MKKRNVILDGCCDAATAAAARAALRDPVAEIKAFTSVYGRRSNAQSLEQWRDLAAAAGGGIPVHRGADAPLFDDYRWPGFPESAPAPRGGRYAWDAFYDIARACEGDLEIFAAGPLTNLALFIKKYHDERRIVKKITVLGGTASFGDSAAYAEFSTWADPLAAEIVADSEIPFQFIPQSAVAAARLSAEELGRIAAPAGLQPSDTRTDWLDYDAPDPAPAAKLIGLLAALHPEIAEGGRYHAKVETSLAPTRGRVIFYGKAQMTECFNAILTETIRKEALLNYL